jgi:hypothetical protein
MILDAFGRTMLLVWSSWPEWNREQPILWVIPGAVSAHHSRAVPVNRDRTALSDGALVAIDWDSIHPSTEPARSGFAIWRPTLDQQHSGPVCRVQRRLPVRPLV